MLVFAASYPSSIPLRRPRLLLRARGDQTRMAKQYTLRKVTPAEQAGPAMLGTFEATWNPELNKRMNLDFRNSV